MSPENVKTFEQRIQYICDVYGIDKFNSGCLRRVVKEIIQDAVNLVDSIDHQVEDIEKLIEVNKEYEELLSEGGHIKFAIYDKKVNDDFNTGELEYRLQLVEDKIKTLDV